MPVKRISTQSLNQLLNGETTENATCVVKIYSNSCDMCHNIKDYYEDIANDYEDIYFYAFNIGDDLDIEKRLGFRGVPTILKIQSNPPNSRVDILGDPHTPNDLTYYRSSDIKNFIEGT